VNLATLTLWLNATMFGLLGAWLLVRPERLDDWLALRAHSAAARTELTALYGGLEHERSPARGDGGGFRIR
jgi:hypothetical protein